MKRITENNWKTLQEQYLPVCWTEKDRAKVLPPDMKQNQETAGKWEGPLPRVCAKEKTEILGYSDREENKEAKEERGS